MTVGELTSFIYLFTLLVFPLRLIGFTLSEVPHSLAGWNRIRDLLDQPVVADPALTLQHGPDHSVTLRDVHFSHDGDRDVLRGVNATIDGGRTVAVVGATGAGKTSLLHLIAGLTQPTSGRVVVANRDLATLGSSERDRWRGRTIGLVPQRLHLIGAVSVARSRFATTMRPAVGWVSAAIRCSTVDLPLPEGPASSQASPASARHDATATAVESPWRFSTPVSSNIALL